MTPIKYVQNTIITSSFDNILLVSSIIVSFTVAPKVIVTLCRKSFTGVSTEADFIVYCQLNVWLTVQTSHSKVIIYVMYSILYLCPYCPSNELNHRG